MIGIGSLLQFFLARRWRPLRYVKPRLIVWGSGFIRPETPGWTHLKRRVDVRAVRGQLTLGRLRKYTGRDLSDVVVGDPGLLASMLIDTRRIKKKYDLGIIPHYMDIDNPNLSKIKVKNAVVLDVRENPIVFLRKMAMCKNIISSAMHGLIVADSLGIPNVRMILSNSIDGGDYKYDDYYSVFGIKKHRKINLTKRQFTDADVATIADKYPIKMQDVHRIQSDLLRVFPYKVKKDKNAKSKYCCSNL